MRKFANTKQIFCRNDNCKEYNKQVSETGTQFQTAEFERNEETYPTFQALPSFKP